MLKTSVWYINSRLLNLAIAFPCLSCYQHSYFSLNIQGFLPIPNTLYLMKYKHLPNDFMSIIYIGDLSTFLPQK